MSESITNFQRRVVYVFRRVDGGRVDRAASAAPPGDGVGAEQEGQDTHQGHERLAQKAVGKIGATTKRLCLGSFVGK